MRVVYRTELSDMEPHRQVGMGKMVISEYLGGEIVSTLVMNGGDSEFDPHSRHNISHGSMIPLCRILVMVP